MTTANEYPTKTLFNEKVGTIVVGPRTFKTDAKADRALKKRGLVLKSNEFDDVPREYVVEHALWCVQSWKDKEGADLTALAKREFLEEYDSLRESILAAASKLNEIWNADVELEEKNS